MNDLVINWNGNIVACPWLASRTGRWALAMSLSVRARRASYELRKMRIVLNVRFIEGS